MIPHALPHYYQVMPGVSQYQMPQEIGDGDLMAQLATAPDQRTSNLLFDEFFARYHHRVVAWCYRVTRDHDSATDLAQEVFLKAFRHSASFRGDCSLSTWLYCITRNHCLSAVRRKPAETVPLEDIALRQLSDLAFVHPCHSAERVGLLHSLLRLMARTLDPLEIRVLTLHYAHEVPLAAITRQLALTNPSGAKAYIVNARRKLNGIARRRGWNVALAATGRPSGTGFWPASIAA